ncbi:hypothetical protein F5Y10DRAFT_264270 [Nemania abortiva]|nr:hypothetical protein F5Y10DRAFT_264270 [Nemania abortiva]
MSNSVYSNSTPDCVLTTAAQVTTGVTRGVQYLIDAVLDTTLLAEIYLQVTSSQGGALHLLILAFTPTLVIPIGTYIMMERMLWMLARDKATPVPDFVGKVSPPWKNPFNAAFVCGPI